MSISKAKGLTSTHVMWAQPKLSSKQSLDSRQCFLQRNHNTCSEFGTSVAIFHYCDAGHVRLLTQPTKHQFNIPIRTKRREETPLECYKTNSSRPDRSYLYGLVTERCWSICTASQQRCWSICTASHQRCWSICTAYEQRCWSICTASEQRCWSICTASQNGTRSKPPSSTQYSTTYGLRNTHRTSPRTVYSVRRL